MGGRVWSTAEKLLILDEYAAARHGSKAAVLRRHQVSYARASGWATDRDQGLLDGERSNRRLRMTPPGENAEIARLRAEVKRLEAERDVAVRDREVAGAAVEVLGKASALLQQALRSAEPPSITRSEPS